MKHNRDWLLQQLGASEIEMSEFRNMAGQNIKEEEQSLLKNMFFIGHTPFDQV